MRDVYAFDNTDEFGQEDEKVSVEPINDHGFSKNNGMLSDSEDSAFIPEELNGTEDSVVYG